jgi:AbiV family abortive infection protein
MSSRGDQPPRASDLLYKSLFAGRNADQWYETVSEGISACCENAERLLADAEYLVQAERLCSARFLITTAREELAKPYILLDACLLDLEKHESLHRALCRAFYNHIYKHAYIEIQKFSSLNSMAEVMDLWRIEVRRWWPSEVESGEPDMPHNTYFDRELPLYVDFSDWSRRWLVPSSESQKAYFVPMFGETEISRTRMILNALRRSRAQGLLDPPCLRVINETFKEQYLGEQTTAAALQGLYEQAARRVVNEIRVSKETFLQSTINRWPLYHCVSQPC